MRERNCAIVHSYRLGLRGSDDCSQKLKINEASARVDRTQLDLDSIADVKTLDRAIKLAFNRRSRHPHPGSLIRYSSDDCGELLSNVRPHQRRGDAFSYNTLHLIRTVLLFRTALREALKFRDRIQRTFAGQCRLQKTLC